MIIILDFSVLEKLFPEDDFDIIFCDKNFKIVQTSKKFDKYQIKLDNSLDTYFVNCEGFLNIINSDKPPAFSYVKLRFGVYYASAVVYLVTDNTSDIRYYFVIEKIKYSQFPPVKYECLSADLMSSHSICALNCTQAMMHYVNKLDPSDANTSNIKQNVDEIAKFCYSNIKTFRSIDVYTNLESASTSFNIGYVDFRSFLNECIFSVNCLAGETRYNTRKPGINFAANTELSPEMTLQFFDHTDTITRIYIKVDRIMLQVALNEIIANSYKFSNQKVNVAIIIRMENNNLYIACSDEGVGFDDKELPDPFLPFAKHHRFPISYDKIGLGLGLSIAKRIIQNFDGDITYSNHKKKPGANVTIRLPLFNDTPHNKIVLTFDKDLHENDGNFPHSITSFPNLFDWKY